MNERYLQKTSVKVLNTFRIFCCIAQSLWKKEEKTRILQNIVGARENMMGGTHFSSNDLKLARKKARGGNTEHKSEFTLQGKRLLRRFFNRDKVDVQPRHVLSALRSVFFIQCAMIFLR